MGTVKSNKLIIKKGNMKTAHFEGRRVLCATKTRSDKDHSACFLLSCLLPIYPTTSIMTVLLLRSRSWNVLSAVWIRLWPDVQDIYSGLKSFPRALWSTRVRTRASEAVLKTCWWLDVSDLFWKHHLRNLWETWMKISPYQTPAIVIERLL